MAGVFDWLESQKIKNPQSAPMEAGDEHLRSAVLGDWNNYTNKEKAEIEKNFSIENMSSQTFNVYASNTSDA